MLFDLGWGFNNFMWSLITKVSFDILDEAHTGRIYSVVAFVESIGAVIGNPLLAATWTHGLNIGGFGLGLPFWVCATIYAAISLFVWRIRFDD